MPKIVAAWNGDIAARYSLERKLASGGSATVYRARDVKHDRPVAVKVLHPELAFAVGADRFHREIRLTAQLQHPNILTILDSGEVEGQLYFVMPLVEGESLRARLDREKQLPFADAIRIATEVAGALGYAHRHGVVHRDVKPENVLLEDGHAVVADFGIARVIGEATSITPSGMAIGTAAYMSPEQAGGSGGVDARSDIYSLGCMLFEMLAGVPPFVGPTAEIIIAQRFAHPPPSIGRYRPTLPERLDEVLGRALALAPADRYATADAFAADLLAMVTETRRVPVAPQQRLPWWKRHRWAVAGGALAAVAALVLLVRAFGGLVSGLVTPLDPGLYAVVPFRTTPSSGVAQQGLLLRGSDIARELMGALRRWEGINLAGDASAEMLLGDGASLTDALRGARRLRAGRLVWGDARDDSGGVRIRAAVYDVAKGRAVRETTLVASVGTGDLGPTFRRVATMLLRVDRRPAAADAGDDGTSSLAAWQAYGRGHVALAAWDLDAAERELGAAVTADEGFAAARVWLAQVRSLRRPGDVGPQLAGGGLETAIAGGRLGTRDDLLARGVLALARGAYADACLAYEQLRRRDSLDVLAWFGLGECNALDSIVVPDPRSRSGWRFRSSFHMAVKAFERALSLEPRLYGLISYPRLSRLLPTEPTRVRVGRGTSPERLSFQARPALISDTVAYEPYSLADPRWLSGAGVPATFDRALEHNRDHMLRFAAAWTRHDTASADAHEALAAVLETTGDVVLTNPDGGSALSSLRRARARATNVDQQIRLAVNEVRLLLKSGAFLSARQLADSILVAVPEPTARQVEDVVGLAALTGRMHRLAELWPQAPVYWPEILRQDFPAPMARIAGAFHARAALGVCDDALVTLERATRQAAASYADPGRRARIEDDLTRRPVSLAVPCLGAVASLRIRHAQTRIVQMQQALARGETRVVRAHLDTLAMVRRYHRPGDISLDHTYREAWIRAAIGDTAGAIAQLDLTLEALPTLSTYIVREPAQAAAVGRVMVWRAELAARRGDRSTARRWAAAATTLWDHADAELGPVIRRMQQLAAP